MSSGGGPRAVLSNKRVEQNATRSAARRQASRACSCAVRSTDRRLACAQ